MSEPDSPFSYRRSSPRHSIESGVGSQLGSIEDVNEASQEEIFGRKTPRVSHLSGDSGIDDLQGCQRRRSKSDSSGRSRVLSLKEARAYLTARTRGVFVGVSGRTRSQSIAEEGEYQFDRQSVQASADSSNSNRPRRNSDQGRQPTTQDPEAPTRSRRPSHVRQFFDNFRPRARSENQQSMARPKRRQQQADTEASADHLRADSRVEKAKQRAGSPIGGIVSRLRQLTTEPDRRRANSGSLPAQTLPAQTLPHPSQMPLDHSFCADLAEQRRARMKKASSVDESDNSKFPFPISIQERHKDLFENLSHSMDIEGQCAILSPTAMAESHKTRRLSGPSMSVPDGSRQRALSGSDVRVTENDKYIIFHSRCRAEASEPNIEKMLSESTIQPNRVFEIFTRGHRCYDLLPISSKLLVFDSSLNVKKAFFALVYNGLRSAPLWDSVQQKFVGMLTVTDFIHILHNQYRSTTKQMEDLETHKISTWRSHLKSRLRPLQWISPEASLFDAVRLLLYARVHRLPAIDPRTGNALFIITHKRILKFIFLYQQQLPMPRWLNRSIASLSVGTFAGIITVSSTTSVINALDLFLQHRVSCLPVLDAEGKLIDIYSKFDVINLAATKTYSKLDMSVGEALKYRQDRFEGVETCTKEDSLLSVMERLVRAEVHRLVIVNADQRVIGLVSLSDILEAVVINYKCLIDLPVSPSN